MQNLSPREFQQHLQHDSVLLLDVRLPEEVEIASLPGALNIPLHELPARHPEVGQPAAVAIYCHHGVRSLQAGRFLERQGHTNVSHLEGGIDAWSADIDPSVARY